ncbi:MAG TPA: TolC family protein, partial [Minicystis sp.]|nr:TolC family protein [Minicystis sp.]
QPLSTFLDRASAANNDLRAARFDAVEKDAEAEAALGHLFPGLTVRGVYTRNEKAITIPGSALGLPGNIVITPANQLDAFFQLDVPIFDPASYGRYRVARAVAAATKLGATATQLEVERQVVRTYYQVLGSFSLVEAAKASADVAARNLQLVKDRRAGGIASDLDAARASADVQRAAEDVADAELALGLATRALESLTMLTPTAADAPLPPDDGHEEAPLATWLSGGVEAPAVRAAEANLRAAETARSATHYAFVPTIAGTAVEHLTNAPAFTGSNAFWTLSASATFHFDYSLVAGLKQANAAVAAARARRDGAQRGADDAIVEAWLRVRANIAKSRAARAQAEAAHQAAQIASDRYVGGIATQLDVIAAQRDAFQADVGRVGADADLAASRVLLRLAANRLPRPHRSTP